MADQPATPVEVCVAAAVAELRRQGVKIARIDVLRLVQAILKAQP